MTEAQNELPEVITNDPRIGKLATHTRNCGRTSPIETIHRFKNGNEIIITTNPKTGLGCGDEASAFDVQA